MNHDRDSLLGTTCSLNASLENRIDDIDAVENHNSGPGGSESAYTSEPKKFRQYFAAFSATLSALAAGAVLGWTSPILDDLTNGKYNGITINNNQMGWIGSFLTLGAMTMCIPTGFICDYLGRKKTLLLLILPFSIGWVLIIFAKNVVMLYIGRLIGGMAVGACCIAAPMYAGEIAHTSLRGALGSFFQLLIVTGIFIAYLFGKILNTYQFTYFSTGLPFIFVLCFCFQPETPTYLLKRGMHDEAKLALIKLRGELYNVEQELHEIEGTLKETAQSKVSLRDTFRQRSVRRAVLIAFALMFFQQFCGINAVILYSSNIFKSSGAKIDPNTATILVGAFQAVATLIASLVIDRLGRKFLLFISTFVVTINTLLLAIYFTLKYRSDIDSDIMLDLTVIPVGALSLFVIAFSLGLGPIPWMISSEIFPIEIKSMVSSVAGTFNWFLAFMVTKFYLEVSDAIGEDTIYYIFTVISLLGTIFVTWFVPETKGKSIAEIQSELES